MDSIVQPAATEQPSSSRNRLLLTVYTAAIFVSALLLFSVQPLFTKMVLPRLGGSPAVWSVAMVFFQSLLLAGYAYAHLLMQVRNRIVPVVVHLLLLITAFVTLPLGIASAYGDPPASGYAVWLLGLFVISIGLPFFALAANNPLLQAWFVRSAPGILPDTIPISSMRPPTSAASSPCCPIRSCWSRCSRCTRRTGSGPAVTAF
ncbi:hypothetical protein ACVWWI_002051 [Bradyrhizobium sp. USDA 3686]